MAKSNLNETDATIAQMLANGYSIDAIAKKFKIGKRTMESRIMVAKKKALSKTLPQFVANYMRKGLIN